MNNYSSNLELNEFNREEVIGRVKIFVEGLQSNLESIFDLYVKLRLDTQEFKPFPGNS
jgi:hypothetical protein